MGLEFGLLGPTQVLHDGSDLCLGPLKQRTLLTALLLQPNRVVPLHRLAAALWDDTPPPSATANLRTYVNRLRKRLHLSPGPERIVARRPGYLIRVRPDELDASVFTEKQRLGREALRNGDPAAAEAALTAGLALWRGAAAEEIPRTPELAPRLEALDEQRCSAVEDLMRARLMLGSDPGLIGDLRRLVADTPVRESMWGLLMLALYRAGSPAAALETYQAARRALREHLGIEPGAELVRLQQGILHRDPRLLEQEPPTVRLTPGRTAPRLLPAAPATFVGRTAELHVLEQALRPGAHPGAHPAVVAVHGSGGSGKSALALKAAASLAEHYPDGQLYVDLGGGSGSRPRSPADALGRLLRGLGLTAEEISADPEERAYRFRELTERRRLLVVLDNAVDEAQVRPLLTPWPESATLITSRMRGSALDGVRHVGLGPLPPPEAVELLAALCGPERVRAEPEAAEQIARLCDHQPLPLWIAGTRLFTRREWSLSAFARLLGDEHHRLDTLRCGDRSVRASIEADYLPLCASDSPTDRRAAALFRRLGLVRAGEFHAAVASTLLACDTTAATAALGRLADTRLIDPIGADRYQLTGLLRVYAAEQAEAAENTETRLCLLRRVRSLGVRGGPNHPHILPGPTADERESGRRPLVPRIRSAWR